MNNDFEALQSDWKNSQNHMKVSASFDDLYQKIRREEKDNYWFYYGTIIILLTTLIVISLFFTFVAPVQETISRIGVGLMVYGLLFRIIIEVISIYKAKQISHLDNTLTTTENTIKFHQFRKIIHQVIAPTIIGLYTIGFYLITPEFSLYIEFWDLVFIDLSYIVIGIILFIVIRKGVKKEMQKLVDIIRLKNEILE